MLIHTIKNIHFTTWPGLTESLIRKHLPKAIATSKGHLRGQQKNIKSTKPDLDSLPIATSLDIAPSQEPSNFKTNNLFIALLTTESICKSFSDLSNLAAATTTFSFYTAMIQMLFYLQLYLTGKEKP